MRLIKKEDFKIPYFKEMIDDKSLMSFSLLASEYESVKEERLIQLKFSLSNNEYKVIDDLIKTDEVIKSIKNINKNSSILRSLRNFEEDFSYVFDKNCVFSNAGRSCDYILELKNKKEESVHVVFSVSDMGVFSGVHKKEIQKMDSHFISEVKDFFEMICNNTKTLRTVLMYENMSHEIKDKKEENNSSKFKI